MASNRKLTLLFLFLVAGIFLTSRIGAQALDDSLDVVSNTNRSAEHSQTRIDDLSRETRILLEEYRSLRESADHQTAYSHELETLDQSQKAAIESLNKQIGQARITRQRILPLMRSMVDALETFVVLDLPFHQQERVEAVLILKQRLDNPGLSVSARFRLLLEAYQIEQGYGDTVEAWRGPLSLDGGEVSVEYLRLGRAALFYQSLDRERSGYWDAAQQVWVSLDPTYNRSLSQAMRVARNQGAPQLLELPLQYTGGSE